MQWAVRNVAVADVRDHLITRPVEDRIYFDELISVLDRGAEDRRPVRGLIGAQPADPSRSAGQRASERFDLAGCAAGMPRPNRNSETVYTLSRDKLFEPFVIGVHGSDAPTVSPLGLSPKGVRLGKQPPGIERDHVDFEFLCEDCVCNRLILDTEASREHDPAPNLTPDCRKALREIRMRKCVRDDEDLIPQNICAGQGCPRCNERDNQRGHYSALSNHRTEVVVLSDRPARKNS